MGGSRKTFRDCFMTGGAIFRADKFGARDARRRKDGAARLKVAARKQNNGERRTCPYRPPEFFALAVEPSS